MESYLGVISEKEKQYYEDYIGLCLAHMGDDVVIALRHGFPYELGMC